MNQVAASYSSTSRRKGPTHTLRQINQGPQGIGDNCQPGCPELSPRWVIWDTPPTEDEDKEGTPGPRQITHHLPPLGNTSPFDLPEDPLDLLYILLIALIWIIHILSVNSLFHQCYGTPEPNLRATRISGELDPLCTKGTAGQNLHPDHLFGERREAPDVNIFQKITCKYPLKTSCKML